jgi:hypothetical protein
MFFVASRTPIVGCKETRRTDDPGAVDDGHPDLGSRISIASTETVSPIWQKVCRRQVVVQVEKGRKRLRRLYGEELREERAISRPQTIEADRYAVRCIPDVGRRLLRMIGAIRAAAPTSIVVNVFNRRVKTSVPSCFLSGRAFVPKDVAYQVE